MTRVDWEYWTKRAARSPVATAFIIGGPLGTGSWHLVPSLGENQKPDFELARRATYLKYQFDRWNQERGW